MRTHESRIPGGSRSCLSEARMNAHLCAFQVLSDLPFPVMRVPPR